MAVNPIDQFIDNLPEDWMRSVFVDRLENTRLLVDDSSFGSNVEAGNAVAAFLQLSNDQRTAEIERLRVRNVATQWAKTATVEAINLLVTALRNIRDNLGNIIGETGASGEIGESEETGESGGE